MTTQYKPGPLSAFKQEVRRLQFLEWLHAGGDVDLAVEILLRCRTGKTISQLTFEMRIDGFGGQWRLPVVNFLASQQLLYLLKTTTKEGGGLYKAKKNAIEEFAYRLAHDGEESPIYYVDELADKRAAAQNKVKAALDAGGWRGKQVRLRIVSG
jgi:hypothetical protein